EPVACFIAFTPSDDNLRFCSSASSRRLAVRSIIATRDTPSYWSRPQICGIIDLWRRQCMPYTFALMLGAALALAWATDAARAQAYPSKPIRWIVTYPPGGPTDFVARAVGARLTAAWSQQVVID